MIPVHDQYPHTFQDVDEKVLQDYYSKGQSILLVAETRSTATLPGEPRVVLLVINDPSNEHDRVLRAAIFWKHSDAMRCAENWAF